MATRSKTVALCAEAWTAGIPLKVTSDGFPIVSKPSQNCQYTVEKTGDIAYVGLPGSNVSSPTKEQVAEFLAQTRAYLMTVPRLSIEELDTAPEGVYTWLLYSKDGSPPQFAASKTTTMLEIGTTHYSIATSVGATAVHGAGELWKHGTQYTFNFLSGTFMQAWKLPAGCPLATMQRYIKQKLQSQVFPDLFRGKTLTFSDDTFIAPRFFENTLTTAELEAYVRGGFVVCIYPEADWLTCKKTKATCARPVTLAQDDIVAEAEFAERMKYPLPIEQVKAGRRAGRGARKKTTHRALRRRVTRRRLRGGVEDDLDPSHPGVQIAEGLVGRNAPLLNPNAPVFTPAALRQSPLQMMFDRITRDLMLTPVETGYMIRTYEDARQRGVTIPEAQLRLHMEQRKRAHIR